MTAIVAMQHIAKDYPNGSSLVRVLSDIDLNIDAGEFVAIMGPSGSGKSTLMNILGCLDSASAGNFHLDGRSVTTLTATDQAGIRNSTLGFVFQGFNLLPRSTLQDNVALPLLYAGQAYAERQQEAARMLGKVGLGHRLQALPGEISGGQQQRVAIARALINKPRLILADEPTGNLDSQTSRDIMALFARLNIDDGITLVLVTHEPSVAAYASRLIRLADGRKVYDGPCDGAHNGAWA